MAAADKLGMRRSGRPTIRPAPPDDKKDILFDIGTAVDAWWSDGWWEGVVIGFDSCNNDNLHVFLSGNSYTFRLYHYNESFLGWHPVESSNQILSHICKYISRLSKLLL